MISLKIPAFMDVDDYLQNPIMRRFLKDHNIRLVENRADYIRAIEDYANQSAENEAEVRSWLCKVVKEGSKEIFFRKIYGVDERYRSPALLRARLEALFPDCPMKNITNYKSTNDNRLIEYQIIENEHGDVSRVDFTFSKLFLRGNVGKEGVTTVFPVFIQVYLEYGFIISVFKAKSTLFRYNESDRFLTSDIRIDTAEHATAIMNKVAKTMGFDLESNPHVIKSEVEQMLYTLYNKFSFTPEHVEKQVEQQNNEITAFVDNFFGALSLDARNKELAYTDAKILVEKFISINGSNEDIFREDRDAYLIKVTADDEQQMTKIDTTSSKIVPLQCTEAFFDSKKAVVKGGKCKHLRLVFKRRNQQYFGAENQLTVQFGASKTYGYVKTMQYAEEADIQNVLQAIFGNY